MSEQITPLVETCPHELPEREDACADGMCPFCLAASAERYASALREIERRIGHFADAPQHEDMPMLGLIVETARIARNALTTEEG